VIFVSVIGTVTVSIIAHATEDESKLKDAAEKAFGTEFDLQVRRGHWGNPINVLKGTVPAAGARKLLGPLDLSGVDLASRTDGGKLYLRLDKGALLRGDLRAGEGVQLEVSLDAPHGTPSAAGVLRSLKG
jgi:RNA binding exosome subunit